MSTFIVDLDGTLLDCRARHYAVYSEILLEMGYEPITEEDYWSRRRAGQGTFEIVSRLPDDAGRAFRITWMSRVERRDFLAMDRPFGGVAPALMDLARDNHLVLVTLRRDPEALAWQLEKKGLAPYFHEVISPWETVPSRKSELLSDWYPMGQSWVIGDTETDIDLAADLNARVICVTNGARSKEFLHARGGTLTLESIAELPEFLKRPAMAPMSFRFGSPVSDASPVVRSRF